MLQTESETENKMTASFFMREYKCPAGCKAKFDSSANAIHHAQTFHGYDRYAVERKTGLSHYDKELWDMLPLPATTDNRRRGPVKKHEPAQDKHSLTGICFNCGGPMYSDENHYCPSAKGKDIEGGQP